MTVGINNTVTFDVPPLYFKQSNYTTSH